MHVSVESVASQSREVSRIRTTHLVMLAKHTLVEHLQAPAKGRPGPAGGGVHMARRMDVRPGAVDGRVDDEAGGVDAVRRGLHGPAVVVHEHQVAGRHQGKVLGVGVDPEPVRVQRVAQADVARGAVGPAETRKRPERRRHVLFRPRPLGLLVGESGDLVEAFDFAYVPVEYSIVC